MKKEERLNELWEELLGRNSSNYDLRRVIEYVGPLREKAGRRLLKQNPSNYDLCLIRDYVESLREEIERLLRKEQSRKPNDEIIQEMINIVENY